MEFTYTLTDTVKIEYQINDWTYFYADTLLVEKAIFDAMSDEEKMNYINTHFEEWKNYMITK